MTNKSSQRVPAEILEALIQFAKNEPEAVANLLVLLATDFTVELVIHEHQSAPGKGIDSWDARSSCSAPEHSITTGSGKGCSHSSC